MKLVKNEYKPDAFFLDEKRGELGFKTSEQSPEFGKKETNKVGISQTITPKALRESQDEEPLTCQMSARS